MVLGLEISTSSLKAMLVDANRGLIKQGIVAHEAEFADIVSMDMIALYKHLIDFVKGFIIGYEDFIDEISLVTLWNSLLFFDPKNKNQPVGRVKTWADVSGDQTMLNSVDDESAITGCPKHYKFTRWKLLREEYQAMLRNSNKVGSIPDYIFQCFTGQWVMSDMMASGSGLLNLSQKKWYVGALESLGVEVAQLPQLVGWKYKASIQKSLAQEIGLSERVMVQVPNGDGGMNQYAESGLELGVWSLSLGTSGALRCLSKEPKVTQGLWCHLLGDGYYVKGATISGAGNCIQWFLERFELEQDFLRQVEPSLSDIEISEQPYYLPFMYGEQSPGWVSKRHSGYNKEIEGYSLPDLYYSLVEGITFNLYQGYELLSADVGRPESIVISGGVVRTKFWLQLIADVLGQQLVISTMEHSSLLGGIISCGYAQEFKKEKVIAIVPNLTRRKLLMRRYHGYLDYYNHS